MFISEKEYQDKYSPHFCFNRLFRALYMFLDIQRITLNFKGKNSKVSLNWRSLSHDSSELAETTAMFLSCWLNYSFFEINHERRYWQLFYSIIAVLPLGMIENCLSCAFLPRFFFWKTKQARRTELLCYSGEDWKLVSVADLGIFEDRIPTIHVLASFRFFMRSKYLYQRQMSPSLELHRLAASQ